MKKILCLVLSLLTGLVCMAQNATITINSQTRYQHVTGFGGFSPNPQFQYWLNDNDIEKLFGKGDNQLGLTIMRTYISNNKNNWGAGIPNTRKAKQLGAIVFASPWSPPANWKTNNNVANGGSLKESNYADWANFLNDYYNYTKQQGCAIDAISVQNEPDWKAEYESCIWTGDQMAKFLREQGYRIGCKIIAPEAINFNPNMHNPILNDAAACAQLDIVGGHFYGWQPGNSYPLAAQKGKEVWMTEFLINERQNNNHINIDWNTDGFLFAKSINDAMLANMSAWVHYALKRFYGAIGDGQYGTVNDQITKRGWVLSQYAKYVSNTTRIAHSISDGTGKLYGSAYIAPSNDKIIVMVINPSGNNYNTTIALPFATAQVQKIVTSGSQNAAKSTDNLAQKTNRPVVNVGAYSVNTFVFTQNGVSTITSDYYAPANLTKPTVEGGENAEYKNGRYYFHYQYSSGFSFYDFQGIRVKDLGNLNITCGSESTCGYRLDLVLTDPSGNEVYVNGTEDLGTRFTSVQPNRSFDLTALLAGYQDYKLDHIRLNTSISADQAAADHDSYYLKVNSIVLGTNSISTPRKTLTSLSKINFNTWTAPQNGTVTEEWGNTCALGKELNGGDVVYGESEVGYLNYGDLTGYKYMTISGTAGKTIRVMFNRMVNEGTVDSGNMKEVDVKLDEQGIATIDLTPYQFVHLNAVKVAWGDDKTKVKSIVLVKEGDDPAAAKTASLSDFDFCSWTAPNCGRVTEVWDNTLTLNKALNGGEIIFGEEKVGYLNYADLSAYKAMNITGTPGKTIRVMFNRMEDEGSVADGKMEEVDVVLNEQGKATVDFRFYPFVHLNAIKPGWGSDGCTINSIELVEKDEVPSVAMASDLEYCEWTAANGKKVGPADDHLNLGVSLNNYGLVYGTESVSEKFYADISGYDVLALTGTPGKTIRVLLNGTTASDRTEVNPTFDENGHAFVDLTAYPYAHLNAIKVGWGDDVNTAVNSIRLMSEYDYADFRESPAAASKYNYASPLLTAITNVVSGKSAGQSLYNLQGQRISAPQRGVILLEGKKVLVK